MSDKKQNAPPIPTPPPPQITTIKMGGKYKPPTRKRKTTIIKKDLYKLLDQISLDLPLASPLYHNGWRGALAEVKRKLEEK